MDYSLASFLRNSAAKISMETLHDILNALAISPREAIFYGRIMIVESYEANFKSLSSHLEAFPIPLQILAATDAETAIAQLQREAIDLVIIDASLRGKMDGYELCRVLRSSESNRNLPIILLLSGYLSLERSKGMSVGADLLLHRPIVKEELSKMIQLLLAWRFHEVGISGMTDPKREHQSLR